MPMNDESYELPIEYQSPAARGDRRRGRPRLDPSPMLRAAQREPGRWFRITNPLKNRNSAQVRCSEIKRDRCAAYAHIVGNPWYHVEVTYDDIPGVGWCVLARRIPDAEETATPSDEVDA